MGKKRRNPTEEPKFLSTTEAKAVVETYFEKAKKNAVRAALCGGFAMQLYGSDRLTKDIDFMADDLLSDRPAGNLSFGGVRYDAGETVVDWIVREDEQDFLYQAALEDRMRGPSGFWIIRPEWLALIKHLARRPKDELDLTYLLTAPGLVDRSKVLSHIKKHFGRGAFSTIDELKQAFSEADWRKTRGG